GSAGVQIISPQGDPCGARVSALPGTKEANRGEQDLRRAPQDHDGLHRVQGAQLHHQEEPPQHPGSAGATEVLPHLRQADGSPRDRLTGPSCLPCEAIRGRPGWPFVRPGAGGAHRRRGPHPLAGPPRGRPVPGADMTTSSETPASSPDPAFAGRTYPPGPVHVVSAAKIADVARATAAPSPLHTDPQAARAAGPPDALAPPTFLVSLAQATEAQYIEDPAAGIDFTRVVHGEESFTLNRAVVAGDRLVPTLTVESVRAAGGHAMVTTRVDLADESGGEVAS